MTTTSPPAGAPTERPARRTPGSPDRDDQQDDRQARAVVLQLAVAGWAITRRPAASHPPDPSEPAA